LPELFVFISPFLKIMEELYSGAGAACNSRASELSPIFCGVHVAQLYSSVWRVAMQTKVPSGFWVDTPCGTLAGAVCEKLGQGQTTPKAPSTTPNSVPCPTGWGGCLQF
jgi:hypothetical protein